jgi:hypothetical protein
MIIVGMLMIGTLVSAKEIEKPATNSTIVVTNLSGSTLYKLHYQSTKTQNVKVSLLDEKGNMVFQEKIRKTDRFIRPYNFKDLERGEYTIQVEDENGKTFEKVNFNKTKIEKWVKVYKMTGQENRFSLIVSSAKKDNVTISIFDGENNLIHSQTQVVDGSFAQLYNVKGVESFSIEVTDSNGLVKSVKF